MVEPSTSFVASLLEHVEEALKREKVDALQALADEEDLSAGAELPK